MKHTLIFFLIIFSIFRASGQRNIWQFDFSSDTVYVRTDTSYILHKATVEIPESGLVILKINGVVSGAKGDNITLGVNKYRNWESNYGNATYRFPDSIFTEQQFNHTMVVDVEPGLQDFYAVMQNWTKQVGTGFAIARGSMIVEYIPENPQESEYSYKRITKYPLILTDAPTVFDSISVQATHQIPYLLSAYFKTNSDWNQNLELIMEYTDNSGFQSIVIPSPFVNTSEYRHFNMHVMAEFSPGIHTIYFSGRKISGDFTSENNSFYGTIYASPLINHEESMPYFSKAFSAEITQTGQKTNIHELTWEAPENGKLFLMTDGYWNGSKGDVMTLEMSWGVDNTESQLLPSFSVDETESLTHCAVYEVVDVTQGQHLPIKVNAFYSGKPSVSGKTIFSGNFHGYFISEIITSSSSYLDSEKLKWTIYPNPSTEKLTVECSTVESACYDFYIVDNSGDLVFQKMLCNDSSWTLDIETLKAGAYNVIIKTPHQTSCQKLVVLH